MEKKITIECGFEEACLIERALDLYSRVGLLQFDKLDMCHSLNSLIRSKDAQDAFDAASDNMKSVFGYSPNSYPGIFNRKDVQDDVRLAADLHQNIRHERFRHRIITGEQVKLNWTTDESKPDICKIAGMDKPEFTVNIK